MASKKEQVSKILSYLSPYEQKKLLNAIRQKDDRLAAELEAMVFRLDDIEKLHEKDMTQMHGRFDKQTLLYALKGVDEIHKNLLLRGLSDKKKKMIEEELLLLGQVKKKETERALQSVLAQIKEYIDEEEIDINERYIT